MNECFSTDPKHTSIIKHFESKHTTIHKSRAILVTPSNNHVLGIDHAIG